jgi:hypothetical protein
MSVPVDSDGIARATFLVTKSGANFVNLLPPTSGFQLITINGINDGAPYSIARRLLIQRNTAAEVRGRVASGAVEE